MTNFADLQRDSGDLGELVNENKLVATRYGGSKKSWQYLVEQFEAEFAQTLLEINKSRGYRVVGTFAAGFEYELFNDVGIDASGNSWIYVGTGAPVKTVTAGTVPSAPDYQQVSYNSIDGVVGLRDELKTRSVSVNSLKEAGDINAGNVDFVSVNSFYSSRNSGGGTFEVLEGQDLSQHDGFEFISLSAIQAWTGSDATTLHANLNTFFASQSGTGTLLKRVDWKESDITLENWGALGSPHNDNLPIQKYNESSLSTFNGSYGASYRTNQLLQIQNNKKYLGRFARITCEAPASSDYHFMQTGEGNGDGKYNWLIRDWEFVNEYTDGVDGHTRKCIWAGDDSSNFKVLGCKFTDFYWNVFVSAKDNGPANQNGDLSYRVPSNFELAYLKSESTLSNAVFIIKGPKSFEVHHCEFDNVGVGSSNFGHGILIDFVSASEGSGVNGLKCSDGKIYNNRINNTRQGGITNAGNNHIAIYENQTANIGNLTGGTDAIPINVGSKYGAVPIGGHVSRNKIGAAKTIAITVSGEVDVISNEIEDACIDSGTAYVNLGTTSAPWQYATAGGNTIKRVNGLNVAGFVLQGVGSGVGCTLLPNHFKGAVQVESRYLGLQGGATIDPTLTIVSQEKTGKITVDGDGVTAAFNDTHGIELLDTAQIVTQTTAGSADAAAPSYVTVSGTTLTVTFLTAPPAGSGNVVVNWTVHNPLYLA